MKLTAFFFNSALFLFLLVSNSGLVAQEVQAPSHNDKLIFAIDLIRHGDRTPLLELPHSSHQWGQGLGELTPLGMHQEYQLGEKLRHEYVIKRKLLPSCYEPGSIEVRSTDTNRTLMSAESFLLGLFPLGTGPQLERQPGHRAALPCRFQPIPIHTLPYHEDDLLVTDNHQGYDFNKLMGPLFYQSPASKNASKRLQAHAKEWERILGVPLTTPAQVNVTGDTLFITKQKKMPLPAGMNDADINFLIHLYQQGCVSLYHNYSVGAATAGKLLREIATSCQQAVNDENNQSEGAGQNHHHSTHLCYLLYSAHDSTQLALLSAMKAPLESPPPYASDLNLELFQTPQHNYYVQMRFNGKPVNPPGVLHGCLSLSELEQLAKETEGVSMDALLHETH